MKLKWSHTFMAVGIYIGMIMPIAVMNTREFYWFTPLLALAIGFTGFIMFWIPLRHDEDFNKCQERMKQK